MNRLKRFFIIFISATLIFGGGWLLLTKMEGEKSVDLPGIGVFEIENGKIKIWRDYFDLGTYLKALE